MDRTCATSLYRHVNIFLFTFHTVKQINDVAAVTLSNLYPKAVEPMQQSLIVQQCIITTRAAESIQL